MVRSWNQLYVANSIEGKRLLRIGGYLTSCTPKRTNLYPSFPEPGSAFFTGFRHF